MDYDIHVWLPVRIKVQVHGVPNASEAVDIVMTNTDWEDLKAALDNISFERFGVKNFDLNTDENPLSYLVDPLKPCSNEYDEDHPEQGFYGPNKERGVNGYDQILQRILNKKDVLPALLGLDEELDKVIAHRLKG